MDIAMEAPGVILGVIEADGLGVAPSDAELVREIGEVCERLRKEQSLEQVADLPAVRSVRAMFRAWGLDPARYRPSSEALLRRVVQGKGLYFVSNVVDVCNLCSIESRLPVGLYDATSLRPPVTFRLGRAGEKYDGIGRHVWHLEGRPVLADAEGPFGSPISDSVRTRITAATAAIATTIFAPATSERAVLELTVERYARRLERFAGACIRRTAILTGT